MPAVSACTASASALVVALPALQRAVEDATQRESQARAAVEERLSLAAQKVRLRLDSDSMQAALLASRFSKPLLSLLKPDYRATGADTAGVGG